MPKYTIKINSINYEVNSDYEYEDQDVTAILNARVREHNGLVGSTHVYPMAAVDTITTGQLTQRLNDDKQRNPQEKRIILIPCNIGNYHWVGLLLEFNRSNACIRVEFMNSTNSDIPLTLQTQLRGVYQKNFVICHNVIKQNDGTSCGACTIENLILRMLKTNRLANVTIPQLRARHLNVLRVDSEDSNVTENECAIRRRFFESFKRRQLLNLKTFNSNQFIPLNADNKTGKSKSEILAIIEIAKKILQSSESNFVKEIKIVFNSILKKQEDHKSILDKFRKALWEFSSELKIQEISRIIFGIKEISCIGTIEEYSKRATLQFEYLYLEAIAEFVVDDKKIAQFEDEQKRRKEILTNLQNTKDLIRQKAAETLRDLSELISEEELNLLRDVATYDVYQTVRIAAAEALYVKGTKEDKEKSQKIFLKLLTYPGFGNPHRDGADLVRERAARAFVILKDYGTEVTQALDHATKDPFQNVSEAATKTLRQLKKDRNTILLNWVQTGDINSIRNWISQGGDINFCDDSGNTPLGIAILNKQWALARVLLDMGARANIIINNPPGGNNVSVMSIPVRHHRWELVKKLIQSGASPKYYCDLTISPLSYFSKINDITMVNYILKKFNNVVDYPNHHSPLKVAVIAGHLNVVQTLVAAGASISNRESLDGRSSSPGHTFTPIQCAAMFGHREIARYLIGLPQHESKYADINIGFSFDLFGRRKNYSGVIDIEKVAHTMLPYINNGFNYQKNVTGKQELRIDILLLQACAKHYALQRAPHRIKGRNSYIRQRSQEYLNRAWLALDIIEKSTRNPSIVSRNSNNSKLIGVLQKMAFAWFCSSVATYVSNYSNPKVLPHTEKPTWKVMKPGWKALSYLGLIIDASADRGYVHGHRLIGLKRGTVFDKIFPNILESLPKVRAFITNANDTNALRVLQATPLYQVAMYLNDFEQLSKLYDMYLSFNEADLRSNDRDRIESALNAIAATLEIITSHLSDVSHAYFHDLDFGTLSQIRNLLRHINSIDNSHHNAFDETSRARRFEALAHGRNPTLMKTLIHFIQHDFAEIRIRISKYQRFLNSINSPEMLYQKFKISEGIIADLGNTMWSHYYFFNYRRNAVRLRRYLEEHEPNNYPQEEYTSRCLRTKTQIDNVDNDKKVDNDKNLRNWNDRVREHLGLKGKAHKEYIKSLLPKERKNVRQQVRELLPNRDQNKISLVFSNQLHCYIKFAANIHYAIASLKRITEISSIRKKNEVLLREAIPKSSSIYEYLNESERKEAKAIEIKMKKNMLCFFNAAEWQAVHFYEHACEFIKNTTFLETYKEQNGDTAQLSFEIEQIRNYIAHTANLRFVNASGLGVDHNQMFELCHYATNIQQGLERVQQHWQNLLDELIAIVSEAKRQEIYQQVATLNLSSENNSPVGNGITRSQLLIGAGIFGTAAAVIGIGYCYFQGQSDSQPTSIPKLRQ